MKARPKTVNSAIAIGRRAFSGVLGKNVLGTALVQIAMVISGAVSARMLGPTDRGYLAVLATVPSVVGQIGAVGISLAATFYLAANRVGGRRLIAVLRVPVLTQLTVLTLVSAAIVLGYVTVSDAPISAAAYISLATPIGALASDYGIALMLGGTRHGLVNIVRVIPAIMGAVTLGLIYLSGMGDLVSVVASLTIITLISGTIALGTGLRVALDLPGPPGVSHDLQRLRREILAFGRRGYIGYLSPSDSFRIDVIAVAILLPPRTLGLYVVGAAFTGFTKAVSLNLSLSATPAIASHHDVHQQKAIARRTLLSAGGLVTVVSVILAIGVVEAIPVVFGEQFASSVPVAEFLILAGWFLALKRVAVGVARGMGETSLGTSAEIVNVGSFAVSCVPAAELAGGPGIAGALAASSALGATYLARRMWQLIR